jgi:class 3 adenylate cyclase
MAVASYPGDICGDGVNIAARLEALAEPGGICILGMVHNQVRDKLPYAGLGFVANGIEKNALKALIVKSK